MSVTAMSWVFAHSPYSLGTRLVHLALADVANDDNNNELWMFQAKIADKAKLSVRQVRRALDTMVLDGALELLEQGNGRGHPSRYRLVLKTGQNADSPETKPDNGGAQKRTSAQTHLLPTKELTEGGRKRATPAPKEFSFTDEMVAWLQALDGWRPGLFFVRAETDKFLDYHTAKGSVFVDWTAAWRKWMRNAVKFALEGQATETRPTRTRESGEDSSIRALELAGEHDEAERLRQQRTGAK